MQGKTIEQLNNSINKLWKVFEPIFKIRQEAIKLPESANYYLKAGQRKTIKKVYLDLRGEKLINDYVKTQQKIYDAIKRKQMNSIFTLERRKNFKECFSRLMEDMDSSIVQTATGSKYSISKYLNRCIRYWPYRCGAGNINDYLEDCNINYEKNQSDRDLLLTLELYINLLYWAPHQDYIDDKNNDLPILIKKDEVELESERLISNISFVLEQCCNMRIRKSDNKTFPKYFITKRNVNVDAAVMAAPELAEVLLGYFDIRNENNLDYKKSALKNIYGYMEPHRKIFKELSCSAISEEFFTGMNTFGIRHNTKAQVKMQSKKKNNVCDMLFKMAIYVLQTTEVNGYKDALKKMRKI